FKSNASLYSCSSCGTGYLERKLNNSTNDVKYSKYDQLQICTSSGPTDPHTNGLIVASALWDLRASVGDVADRLVLGAIPSLGTGPNFACFAYAVFKADQTLYSGSHATAIASAFNGRGISVAPGSITGPSPVQSGQSNTYSWNTSCG